MANQFVCALDLGKDTDSLDALNENYKLILSVMLEVHCQVKMMEIIFKKQ